MIFEISKDYSGISANIFRSLSRMEESVAWPRAENCFAQDQISYDSKEIIEHPQHVARIRSICGGNKELGRIAARAKQPLFLFLSLSLSPIFLFLASLFLLENKNAERHRCYAKGTQTALVKRGTLLPLLQSMAQLRLAKLQFSISVERKAGTLFRIFR